MRAQALERDAYRCVKCGADVSGPGKARVDHIKPRAEAPYLELALSNLRTLCASCDNQAHREKGRRYPRAGREERFVIRGSRADGSPLDPKHPWNKEPR